jgi:hypothetical protein
MDNTDLIHNILNVVTCSTSFNPNDYSHDGPGTGWGYEIEKYITDWVNSNDIRNIKCIVDLNGINTLFDLSDLLQISKFHVDTVENMSEINELAQSLITYENMQGPGWDGSNRDCTMWNSEYFFTGSDCTYYILLQKID